MMRALAGSLAAFGMACLAFVACGGGGGDRLSEEEYFERVEELISAREAAYDEGFESLTGELDLGGGEEVSDEVILGLWSDLDLMKSEAYQTFTESLDDLRPPSKLESQHEELLKWSGELAEVLLAGITYQIEPADASDETFERAGEIAAEYADACRELQGEARASGVAVDLLCTPGRVGGETICVPGEPGLECFESAGSDEIDIAPGISGELLEMPPLPDGLLALSQYIEFEVEGEAGRVTIGLPLDESVEDASGLAFYSYEDGEWVRIDVRVTLAQDGTVAQADFDAIPASLAVLREE